MFTRTLVGLALFLSCALAPACSSYTSYRFGPALQDVLVRTNDGSEVIASALVSSRGIASHDDRYEVRFRLRLQNQRPGPLVVGARLQPDLRLPPRVEVPRLRRVHELRRLLLLRGR